MNDPEHIIDTLEELLKDQLTSKWAAHKKTSWVLSGLSAQFTKMDQGFFANAQRDTNLVESMHQQSYQEGKGLTLLKAIEW